MSKRCCQRGRVWAGVVAAGAVKADSIKVAPDGFGLVYKAPASLVAAALTRPAGRWLYSRFLKNYVAFSSLQRHQSAKALCLQKDALSL